jgi:hypothetical protein
VTSVVIFEPVTTVAEVLAGGSPRELTRLALPLMVGFSLFAAVAVYATWGRTLLQFAAIGLTSALLVFLLGANVAVLGLVQLATAAVPLVGLAFGLTVVLAAGFAGAFLLIERRAFRRSAPLAIAC